ncbi:MAG: Fic family protein [Pseudonocardiaceae bacterium]
MIYQTPPLGPEEQAALTAIDRVRKQLRFSTAEPRRWVGSVRRVLAARAIQGSNSIEGYNVSVEDAIAAIEGEELIDASALDRQAVSGYRRAMTYVIGLAKDDHFEYSTALLRSLHFMMTECSLGAWPGRWRPGPIWIRNDTTDELVYEAPEHEVVPQLVGELVEELESDGITPVIVRGAMAHLNLVMIHPFRDGNGRMSRCLQTLVLARERILAQELSSIEEYLGRNTEAYYRVLAQVGEGSWHPGNDARPWVRFCLEAHYVQAESVLRRIRESGEVWIEIEKLRHEHRLPERVSAALFDAAIGLRVHNAGYRALLRGWDEEISNQVATTDLRAMVNAGLLRAHGRNRGAYYDGANPLREIGNRARRSRRPIDTATLFDPAAH